MNKLESLVNKGIDLSIFFILITFPIPFQYSNIALASLTFFWLIQKVLFKKPNYENIGKNEKWIFYSFLAFLFWQIIALFYTSDISQGLKYLEGKLSLLILPIVLFDLELNTKRVYFWLRSFVYSISIYLSYLFAHSILAYVNGGIILTYHDFTAPLYSHAIYFSYYLFTSILISVFLIISNILKQRDKKAFYLFIIYFFLGLLITASKNVLVITTLLLIIFLLIRSIKYRPSLKQLSIVFFITIISIIGILTLPSIKNRISELTELNGIESIGKIKEGKLLLEEDITNFNGTSLRLTFWYVAINRILEDGVLLNGYSPTDRKVEINREYYRIGLNPWYKNYDLHNQFIQILLDLGLIGLSIYLILHYNLVRLSLRKKNYLLLFFVIGFIFFQFTESILERNKGIVFFLFFILFFIRIKSNFYENRNIRN